MIDANRRLTLNRHSRRRLVVASSSPRRRLVGSSRSSVYMRRQPAAVIHDRFRFAFSSTSNNLSLDWRREGARRSLTDVSNNKKK